MNENGIDFLQPKHATYLDGKMASMIYLQSVYPKPASQRTIQWRAEGEVKSIDVESVLDTAPYGSFAQIMASSYRRHGRPTGRFDLDDPDRFEEETLMIK